MAHKVHVYDLDKGFDADGFMRPVRTVETDDPSEMLRIAVEAMQEAGSAMAASTSADWRLSETLAEHLRISNARAHWLADNPIGNSWVSALHEDIAEWNASGVHTPEDLEKSLLLQTFSDHYKELHGFRPRGVPVSMDMSIEEIEAALEGGSRDTDLDAPYF